MCSVLSCCLLEQQTKQTLNPEMPAMEVGCHCDVGEVAQKCRWQRPGACEHRGRISLDCLEWLWKWAVAGSLVGGTGSQPCITGNPRLYDQGSVCDQGSGEDKASLGLGWSKPHGKESVGGKGTCSGGTSDLHLYSCSGDKGSAGGVAWLFLLPVLKCGRGRGIRKER